MNPKNDCSIQISLICLAKEEEMRSKLIEVERVRPGRKLKNSSNEIKLPMFLKSERAEKSCSFSNLVVYSITGAGLKFCT